MGTASERRIKVRDIYRKIIGRNIYSQGLRNYCYTPYKDGKYYSDCSSSISYAYKEAGEGFGVMRTTDMYASAKFEDVPVVIQKGQIKNPEVLRIGDMLLFAGTDAGRKKWGYVGHVEMVGEISGTKVTLYGHGSGRPKKHDMVSYCKSRYGSKTSATPIGNKGLIRVRRFIQEDGAQAPEPVAAATPDARILKNGCAGADVKALQEALIRLGHSCGSYGADGDFGDCTEIALRAFQAAHGCGVDGVCGPVTRALLAAALEALEAKYAPPDPDEARHVQIDREKKCYIRSGPGTEYRALGVAHGLDRYPYQGETYENGWFLIEYQGKNACVSGKYAKLVK